MSLANKETVKGRIHSFESFGTVDGQGVRYVTFMQGCHFNCLYCHNPDTIEVNSGNYQLTAEELIQRVRPLKGYYRKGGVTVSGGEPLLQAQFIKEYFEKCKEEGLHTAVDTAGVPLTDTVKAVLENTDMVMLDIKCTDEDVHEKLTGHLLNNTWAFAKYLEEKNIRTWIRHVLVPGITDKDELLEQLGEKVSKMKNVELVELLPFHKLGLPKYEMLGREYPLKDTETPTKERVENAKSILRKHGLKVK